MIPIISIVVPIYKVEEYLHRCIESLIKQTYKDIEIILVNDGSPDNCPNICDDYAKKDSRVKVIHKSNGGLSDARNYGLKESKGKYVLFVDSDDYIELDTCERFIEVIKMDLFDIVVANANRIENNKIYHMKHNFINKKVSGKEYLKNELKSNSMHMAAWLSLYNREFLIKNNLEFKVGILHEDVEFTPRVFLKAKSVIGIDVNFYNYIIREDSITMNKNKIKNAEHIIDTIKYLDKIYDDIEDIELKSLLKNSLIDAFLNTFQVCGLHRREYNYLIDKNFLKGKANTKRNILRINLFLVSKNLYYYTNKLTKNLKSLLK